MMIKPAIRLIIGVGEGASGEQRGMHGLEISGHNDLKIRCLELAGIRQSISLPSESGYSPRRVEAEKSR